MGIEKAGLLACQMVYWINMYTDIENTVKQCATLMEYQQTQLPEKTMPYDMLYKPQELVGADTCPIKNNT